MTTNPMRIGIAGAHPSGKRLFGALVDEALSAALACGAPLPEDARQQVGNVVDRMDVSSSKAEDLAAGRVMEVDAFSGHVVQIADKYKIAVPVTRVIHDLLEVLNRKQL